MAYTKEVTSIKALFQPENARETIKARVILKKFEETLGKLREINQHKKQKLFISYVWATKKYHPQYDFAIYKCYECYVEKIAEHLQLLGFEVYLDKWKDRGNQDYQTKLLEAIEEADKFLVFLSPLYMHKFTMVKKGAIQAEHVVRVEGLLMNHALFRKRVTQENLFPVYLEPTPEDYRLLPMVNRGYLSQEKGGIEACDYFHTFLFDLCKDLLNTGYGDVNWNKFEKIKQDFYRSLRIANELPEEKLEEPIRRWEQKEEKKNGRCISEYQILLDNIGLSSSSEEEREEDVNIPTIYSRYIESIRNNHKEDAQRTERNRISNITVSRNRFERGNNQRQATFLDANFAPSQATPSVSRSKICEWELQEGDSLKWYPLLRIPFIQAKTMDMKSRFQLLRTIRNTLESKGSTIMVDAVRYSVLNGMGGVGKTSLALRYAYEYREEYDIIQFIDGSKPENLDREFEQIAERLFNINITDFFVANIDIVGSIYRSLYRAKRRFLLIFDNIREQKMLKGYLPSDHIRNPEILESGFGQYIITSRHREWDASRMIGVEGFTHEEISLCVSEMWQKGMEEAAVERLAKAMDSHPFGIIHSINYIRMKNKVRSFSIDDFLAKLSREPEMVFSGEYRTDYEQNDPFAHNALLSISLSIDWLLEETASPCQDGSLHMCCCLLLGMFSYLQRTGIPTDIVSAIFQILQVPPEKIEDLQDQLMGYLIDYNIIQFHREEQRITLHQLTQKALQLKKYQKNNEDSFLYLPTVLDKKFCYDRNAADLKNTGYQGWFSQTELFLTNYYEDFLLQNPLALKLCHKLGSYYVHEKRDMKNALIWLQKTEKALLSGSGHLQTLLTDVYIDMQKAFISGREDSQCEAYAKKVLAHNKAWKTTGIRNLDEAYACHSIAFLEYRKNNRRLVEQYHLQILAYLHSCRAPHSVKYRYLLAVTYRVLGCIETEKKHFLRAIDYARQSREIFVQFLPDNHYQFWTLFGVEAVCFTELSDKKQLRKTGEEAVRLTDSWADLYGIQARYDYATSCIKLGDRETAAALHAQIFQRIRDNPSL